MAARSTRSRSKKAVEDPVEAVEAEPDEQSSEALDEDLDDAFVEDDLDDLDADAIEDDDLDDLEDDDVEEGDASLEVELEAEAEDDLDDTAGAVEVPIEASFDDEDAGIVAVVAAAEDDGSAIEGVREGEFVCRSCHMAKRETQLADEDALLCRDCA